MTMPLMRRRPLLRAAMVGGAAYATGKHVQRRQEHEYEQDQMLADMQQQPQQYAAPTPLAPPPPPAPAAAQSSVDRVAALTQLKSLLDAGALTQEEFDTQKRQILEEG
jgi:hypothetical protein